MRQMSDHLKALTPFLSGGVSNASAFPNSFKALLVTQLCCSEGNDILVRFLTMPYIFGLRHSQLLCKTQSGPLYKISVSNSVSSLTSSLTPSIPAPTSPGPSLALERVASVVGEGQGTICSPHNCSIFL